MTNFLLAGAIAALAVFPVAGSAMAAEASSGAMLFGKEPGPGHAFACFNRHYDAPHLTGHPRQNVRDMTMFVDSWSDADSGRQYSLGIGVKFRAVKSEFQLSGGCSSTVDGKNALSCGIDCDGGHIDVRVRDANSVLVGIPDGARTWDPESENEPPKQAHFGADDKLFRLDRTDLKQCLPLVADEDIRAEISAAK
jgi:hypothetical protein